MSDEPASDETPSERKPFEKKAIFDKKLTDRPEKFEDYPTWQEARRLTTRFYEITDQPAFANDAGVRDAIRKAVVDVMSQLAAAVEASSDKGFSIGLSQAKSSAAELRSLVFVAVDRGYLTEQEQTELVGRAASMARSIGTQIFRLKRTETTDFKKQGGRPGGFGPRKTYGSGPGGPRKPFGGQPGGGFGGKKPFRPKRDE